MERANIATTGTPLIHCKSNADIKLGNFTLCEVKRFWKNAKTLK